MSQEFHDYSAVCAVDTQLQHRHSQLDAGDQLYNRYIPTRMPNNMTLTRQLSNSKSSSQQGIITAGLTSSKLLPFTKELHQQRPIQQTYLNLQCVQRITVKLLVLEQLAASMTSLCRLKACYSCRCLAANSLPTRHG